MFDWRSAIRSAGVMALIGVLTSCGPDGAEEGTLRHALRQDPVDLAALPEEERRALALRAETLQVEQWSARETAVRPATEAESWRELLAADGERAAQGAEALVLASVRVTGGEVHVGAIEGDGPPAGLPALEGAPALGQTSAHEERALTGRAGRVLGSALLATGTRRMLRVVGWPMGVVAVDDILYVNASWLVLMSALEQPPAPPPPLEVRALATSTSALAGNPFIPPTLQACVDSLKSDCERCRTQGMADAEACKTSHLSDMTFSEQCAHLDAAPERYEQLCVLILLSIGSVFECVEQSLPRCALAVEAKSTSLPGVGERMKSEPGCLPIIEDCAAKRADDGSATSGGGSGGSCSVVPEETSVARRLFWLFGPLFLILATGHRNSWNRRS